MKLEKLEMFGVDELLNCDRYPQPPFKPAFEERLVLQNPEDEPASKLLERVREGRELI